MPRTCTICSHPKRKQIESLLGEGTAYRTISDRYGPSKTALLRHTEHVKESISQAKASTTFKAGLSLIEQLAQLHEVAEGILTRAIQDDNGDLALKALDRRHKQIELAGRLQGEFQQDKPNMTDQERSERAAIILSKGKLRSVA